MNDQLLNLTNQTRNYVKKNAPTILTFLGIVGVVATSVSTVKSYKKYEELSQEVENDKGEKLNTVEKIKIAIPSYAPTIFIGATTISCIIGSNALNKKKQAALSSAYMILDTTYKEYRSKIRDIYGVDVDEKIEHEIVKDKCEVTSEHRESDKRLFFEPVSQKYFESTIADIQKAEYLLNRKLVSTDYARINDFLKYLGLEQTDIGDVIGWSTFATHDLYGCGWIDFKHEKVELEDGLECYIIRYPQEPRLDYMDY